MAYNNNTTKENKLDIGIANLYFGIGAYRILEKSSPMQ